MLGLTCDTDINALARKMAMQKNGNETEAFSNMNLNTDDNFICGGFIITGETI